MIPPLVLDIKSHHKVLTRNHGAVIVLVLFLCCLQQKGLLEKLMPSSILIFNFSLIKLFGRFSKLTLIRSMKYFIIVRKNYGFVLF